MALAHYRNPLASLESTSHSTTLTNPQQCLLSYPNHILSKAEEHELNSAIKSEEEKASHVAETEILAELDEVKLEKRNRLLTNFVRGIASLAVENGDSRRTLQEWKIRYSHLFINSNRTDLAFEVIRRKLRFILRDVKKNKVKVRRISVICYSADPAL